MMTSMPAIRGWCPTVFEPMAAADGLLARVKPRVRGWTALELRKIAAAATAHGSGQLLVTHHGNLQVRGLSAASARAFAAEMLDSGLVSAGRDAERRRNIVMLPSQTDASEALATRLETWLEGEERLAALPGKFCFAVTSGPCGVECMPADLCIHVLGTSAWVGLRGVDGHAEDFGALTEEPLAAVAAITRTFLHPAPMSGTRPRRLRELTAEVGIDAVLGAAGLRATPLSSRLPQQLAARGPGETVSCVGPCAGRRFGLGVPFGRADAAMLFRAAELADQFGDGRLRPTVYRTFLLSGTLPGGQPELSEQGSRAGFVVDARDPRMRVAACVGGSGCDRTTVDVQAAAASLAPWWSGEGVLHVSGCPKGCAHPGAAAVTLLAGAPDDRFYVLRDARADAPVSHAMPLEALRELLSACRGRSPS